MNFKEWLLSEERILNEDFKTQREKFIQQGIQPPAVDYYLNNFKIIKDKKYKQINDPIKGLEHIKDRTNIDAYKIWKELEDFVDYVKSQVDVSGKTSYKNIKVDAEPIHTDNDLIIYYADTPQACVTYKGDVPYGWCIARSDASNMFYNYRFQKHEPSFYFVKNKERTNKELETFKGGNFIDKYHFFVIQVIRYADLENKDQKQYIVTSAQNDGDIEMSWNDILKLEPKLTNKHNIFISNPLGPKERELYYRFVNGISDKEFEKLPFDEKDMYLSVYVRQGRPITANQFKNLPHDLKNKYIGFGVGVSDEQFKMIDSDSKLYKRYEDVTKTKIKKIIETDLPLNLTSNEADIFLKNINEFDWSQFSDNNFQGVYNSNNVELAKLIIEKRVLNFGSINSLPPSGNFEVMKYLLGDEVRNKQGDIVELPKWMKPWPIDSWAVKQAVERNNLEMVEYLIGKGSKILESAVADAAKNNNLEMVEYLVKKGAEIDKTAIGNAAQNNNYKMVDYLVTSLIEKGSKINDNTAVANAAKNNNLEMVKYLIEKGANIDNNAVAHAAYNNNLEMVKYLVTSLIVKGAKINDNTAVEQAAQNNNLEMAEYLIEKGAKINDSAVEQAAQNNNLEMVKYLVKKGANIDNNAVANAAYNNNYKMVDYLLEKLLEKGEEEISEDAVTRAVQNNNLEMAEYLIGKGAKINDYAVVAQAVENNNLEMLKYWVEKIGNLGDIGDIGLHWPIENGNLEIIKYLLGDEARDEKGNIVKLPEKIKPIIVTDGDWNSILNSHARNIEEIKEYIIKKEKQQNNNGINI